MMHFNFSAMVSH